MEKMRGGGYLASEERGWFNILALVSGYGNSSFPVIEDLDTLKWIAERNIDDIKYGQEEDELDEEDSEVIDFYKSEIDRFIEKEKEGFKFLIRFDDDEVHAYWSKAEIKEEACKEIVLREFSYNIIYIKDDDGTLIYGTD